MSIAAKCTCGYSVTGICTSSITECKNLIKSMDKTTERIKADADQHVKGLSIQHSKSHQHAGYIAGATDVYERAEPMAEVLEYIIHCPATYDKTQLLIWIDSAIAKAKQALEQWKGTGKEVEQKCTCRYPTFNAMTDRCLTCNKPYKV